LRRFLHFTVEQELKGEGDKLKEYQIGVEVFDRKESYDPRIDPIVRVEASRLRSKLKEYYSNEGREDPVLIEFPKGSYVPVFGERQAGESGAQRILAWFSGPGAGRTRAALAGFLLAILAAAWGVALFRENASLRRQLQAPGRQVLEPEFSPLWGQFFVPGARNYVVFGSPIFFASERQMFFLRWQGLSNPREFQNDPTFQDMQRRFGPLSGPRYDYALMADATALQRLTAFFGRAGASLTAIPAHQATWRGIQDGNVVFLGAPRMNPLLGRLPVQQDFEWDPDHNVVNRNPRPGEERKYVTASHYDEVSYAVIARFPGLRPNRHILLLTAHSEPGILAAVDYVTQVENARALIQRLGPGDASGNHFELLLRVIVDKGAPVKSEYVTHHPAPIASRGQ
jgi:hypothetical protein